MSGQELEFMVLRIQRKLLEGSVTFDKKLKYLKFLSHANINFNLLKKTSIGKTINTLRKDDGVVGEKSKELIIKWKNIASKVNKPIIDKSLGNNYGGDIRLSPYKKQKLDTPVMKSNDSFQNKIPHKDMGNMEEYHTESLDVSNAKMNTSEQKKSFLSLITKADKDTDAVREVDRAENGKSFEEMLIMPMVKLRKRKNNLSQLKRSKISMPQLPDIELPSVTSEPNYHPAYIPPPPQTSANIKFKKNIGRIDVPNLQDIVSRKTRSHMYTGKKNNTGIVTSLHQQAMRVLIDNVDALYDTGGVPFFILKPLLSKCTPCQLERLEEYNPHFVVDEDSDELWKIHCQREFKGRSPDDMEQWRELYKRLGEEREMRLKKLSSKITANYASKMPERSVKLAYVAGAFKPTMKKKHGLDIIARRKTEDKMERSEAVAIPFCNVPKRERCSIRPPYSLSRGGSFNLPEPRKKKTPIKSLGSSMSSHPKKQAKKPMMAAALKLMKNQKGRINSRIVRR